MARLLGEDGDALGVIPNDVTGVGQFDPVAQAVKEGDPQLGFQQPDVLGDGWLAEVEVIGSLCET
jgi:hypothetical protein